MRVFLFFILRNIITYLDDLIGIFKKNKKKLDIPERLLIIRWDRIGDAVATVPLIEAINKKFPTIKIDILCSEYNAWVFEACEGIQKIIRCPGLGFSYGEKRMIKFLTGIFMKNKILIKALENNKYDQCLDCLGGEYTFSMRSLAKVFIGQKTEDGFSWIYDSYPKKPIRYSEKTIAQYYFDHLCSVWGKPSDKVIEPKSIPVNHSEAVSKILKHLTGNFIMLNISGSDKFRAFQEVQLLELISKINNMTQLVIFDDHNQAMMPKLAGRIPDNVVKLPKLTLPELAAIAKNAKIFIGNEGGATHYCSSQCNSIKLFISKSYDYHFFGFTSNTGTFSKTEDNNSALWENKQGDYILIPKPRRRYPFRPYIINVEQQNLKVDRILEIINKSILN